MSSLGHLARRFLGSLSPRGLAAEDAVWVDTVLTPAEQRLWSQLSSADRKHAAGVAREVDRRLADADRAALAAALLHDIGKIDADLGTLGRVVATLTTAVLGRDRVAGWNGDGVRGRFGRYVRHDEIGANLLRRVGSDPLTIAWTREHHLGAERWSVPRDIAEQLHAADDD